MTPGQPQDTQSWLEAGSWAARARRMGPIRCSDLGPRRSYPPAGVAGLASWIVDSVDGWWNEGGQPDPYTLVVVSGDEGALAREVLAAGPECLEALRYVMVDPVAGSSGGSGRPEPPVVTAGLLALEEPVFLFPSSRPGTTADPDDGLDPDESPPPAVGVGPLVTFLADIPVLSEPTGGGAVSPVGAVVVVETLGRMPYEVLEWDGSSWLEVRVAAADLAVGSAMSSSSSSSSVSVSVSASGDVFEEVLVPLDPDRRPAVPAQPEPGRYVIANGARQWLRRVLGSAPSGVVAVVDRWAPTTEPLVMASPAPAGLPASPVLALDQMARVRPPEPPGMVLLAGEAGLGPAYLGAVTWRIP